MGCCNSSVPYLFPDGGVYTGEMKDGFPVLSFLFQDGKGQITWSNGSSFEGTFVKGKKCGKGLFKWNDQSYYNGNFKDENFDGYGEYYWPDGRIYKGAWVDGKMEGQGYLYHEGKEYTGI